MKNNKKYLTLGAGLNLGCQPIRKFTTEGQEKYTQIIADMVTGDFDNNSMIYKKHLTGDFLTDTKYATPIGKSSINLGEFTENWLSKSKNDQITPDGLPIITHFIFQKYLNSIINAGEINTVNIGPASDWILAFCFPYFMQPVSN